MLPDLTPQLLFVCCCRGAAMATATLPSAPAIEQESNLVAIPPCVHTASTCCCCQPRGSKVGLPDGYSVGSRLPCPILCKFTCYTLQFTCLPLPRQLSLHPPAYHSLAMILAIPAAEVAFPSLITAHVPAFADCTVPPLLQNPHSKHTQCLLFGCNAATHLALKSEPLIAFNPAGDSQAHSGSPLVLRCQWHRRSHHIAKHCFQSWLPKIDNLSICYYAL